MGLDLGASYRKLFFKDGDLLLTSLTLPLSSLRQTTFLNSLLPRLPSSLAFVSIDALIAGLGEGASPEVFQGMLPSRTWEGIGFTLHNSYSRLLYLSPRRSTGDLISPPFSLRDLLSMSRTITKVPLYSACLNCLLRFCFLPNQRHFLPEKVEIAIEEFIDDFTDLTEFITKSILPDLSRNYPTIFNSYLSSYNQAIPLPPTNGGSSSPVQARHSKRANTSSAASSTSSSSSLLSSGPGPPSSGPPRSSRSASSLGSGGSDVPPPRRLTLRAYFLFPGSSSILQPAAYSRLSTSSSIPTMTTGRQS